MEAVRGKYWLSTKETTRRTEDNFHQWKGQDEDSGGETFSSGKSARQSGSSTTD